MREMRTYSRKRKLVPCPPQERGTPPPVRQRLTTTEIGPAIAEQLIKSEMKVELEYLGPDTQNLKKEMNKSEPETLTRPNCDTWDLCSPENTEFILCSPINQSEPVCEPLDLDPLSTEVGDHHADLQLPGKLNNRLSSSVHNHLDARILFQAEQVKNFRNKLLDLQLLYMSQRKGDDMIKFLEIIENSVFSTGGSCQEAEEEDDRPPVARCTGCSKQYGTLPGYARHLYAHTFIKQTRSQEFHLCTICAGEFVNRKDWEEHKTALNCCGLPKVVSPCLICGIYLQGKKILREHLLDHATEKLHSAEDPGVV